MAPNAQSPSSTGRKESREERADRNFVELLQGFRVAVTGVQVLFAFLLTVPFSQNFDRLGDAERLLYMVALVSAAVASVCYLAPTAQHRILFRQGMKESLVRRSNIYGIFGGVALVISMTSATIVVVDYLHGGPLPAVVGGALAVFAVWSWFLQPTLQRRKGGDDAF